MHYSSMKYKTIVTFCVLGMLLVTGAYAQTYPTTSIFNTSTINTLQLYTSTNTIWGRDTLYYWNTPNNHGNIGYLQTDHWITIDGQPWNFYEQEKNRSVLTISFSGSTIPADASINGIQIVLSSATNGSLTATIGKLADGNITTNKAGWDKFTSGSNTIYNSNINYNTPTPVSITQGSPLWNAVISTLSAKTTMSIFARSNSESNGTSNATISAAIYVLWTPKISVTVQNAIGASPSKVNIDGYEYPAPKTSTWDAGSPHTLLGWDQEIGGLVYPFLSWTNVTSGQPIPGNPIPISPTSNTTYQANYGPGAVATIIDQKNASNISTDSVDVWEGGNHFQKYRAPVSQRYSPSSSQVLRGVQKILSGEKYNYWKTTSSGTIASDVTNHRNFTILTNISPIVSQLAPTVDGTSFGVTLEGANVTDAISFKDPWLVDYTDGYGARNQGASAPFKSIATGGNPLGVNTNYKGVLKNQTSPETYSVQATSPKTINGISSVFLNWSSNANANVTQSSSAISPVVFTNANAVVTANYKGVHISNTPGAISSPSQRKIIRDGNILYTVYISMDKVWLEQSTDNGATWTICNNGKWLNTGTNPVRNPTIHKVIYGSLVMYEEVIPGSAWTLIKVLYYPDDPLIQPSIVGEYDVNNPSGASLFPVMAFNNGNISIAYTLNGAVKVFFGYSAFYAASPTFYPFTWRNVNLGMNRNGTYQNMSSYFSSSRNPSFSPISDSSFYMVWEKGNSIYYARFTLATQPEYDGFYNVWLDDGPRDISSGNSCNTNSNPVLIRVGYGATRVAWIGKQIISYPGYSYTAYHGVLFKDATDTRFWYFGYHPLSVNINMSELGGVPQGYVIGWSDDNNYAFYTTSSTLGGTIRAFSKSGTQLRGKDIQVTNGSSYSNMYGMVLNTSTSPYSIQQSENVLGKSEIADNVCFGREGVITKDSSQIYFALGDITVDGEKIDFVEIADTLFIRNKSILNSCLVSEPFVLTDKSDFTYGVQFGFLDSISTTTLLRDGKFVNFKVVLETAKGEQIGEFDNVTFNKRNMVPYQNQGYKVSTDGIGSKLVRLRLIVATNFNAQYSLVQKYNTESAVGLGKDGSNFKQIGYKGAFPVEQYTLEQNYPNPFNPTTTISYAIPQEGLVTLKIYDALGREVQTLVNEFKSTGRYTAEFDASKLSSGVYIYKLVSDKYSAVKKMLLIK